MNLTVLLDVTIGLSLVYLGASLFVTIINEYLGQLMKLRSKQLKADLKALIDSEDAIAILKSNPALAPFFPDEPKTRAGDTATAGVTEARGTPAGSGKAVASSYVDTTMLARQLIGGLQRGARAASTMSSLIASINSLPSCKLKTQLLALSQATTDNVDKFVQNTSA